MKKTDLLNAPISEIIASMGHTDRLIICDSGLPIPQGANKVDLALKANIPSFIETLKTVLTELKVEEVIIASEVIDNNKKVYGQLLELVGDVKITTVNHDEFKAETRSNGNASFIRTGEASPYANIILISGVTFN